MSARRRAVGLTLVVAAAVCALGLGRAGLWPGELAALDPSAPGGLAGALAQLAVRALGASDAHARLPGALLALSAAGALAWAVARVLDARAGAFAGVAYATLPLVLQNARAVSDAGVLESLAAIAFAATLVAVWAPPARRIARAVACALAVALLAYACWHAPALDAPAHSFDALIEPLAHATLPWTGFAVFALAALPSHAPDAHRRERGVRAFAFAAALVAFVAHSALSRTPSGASLGLGAPLAVALALLLRDAEREPRAARAAALGALLALLIGLRDVALFPASAFTAIAHLAPAHDAIRSPAAWLAPPSLAAFAAGDAPLGYYMALALGPCALVAFALAVGRARVAWVPATAVFAALVFAHLLGPALSRRLSPRDAFTSLAALRAPSEPAARFADDAPAAPRWYAPVAPVAPLARAPDALAWLLEPGPPRRWLVLGDGALASLNRDYRRATGRNAPVARDTGAGLLVLVSDASWPSRNPLDAIVSDREPVPSSSYRALPGGTVVLDDAVEILGADQPATVRAGGALEVRWHFHVLRDLPGEMQVFVHVDGPCARINGDHAPRYPVSDWIAGDHVLDAQRIAIPAWCRRGRYTAYVGLFAGDRRARARGGEHTPDDRVAAAVFDVR